MRQGLKKHWKKMVLIASVGLVLIIEALVLTADHWWKKLGEARVTYNGQLSGRSRVYRSPDGNLLISLAEEGEGALYIIYTGNEIIGMANTSNFILLPWYAYSRNLPPPFVVMQSVKIEVDPQLVVQQRLIEFNSFEKSRVRVTW